MLATFCKLLYHPNRNIDVYYAGAPEKSKIDAYIRVRGSQKELEGWGDVTPIEITCAYYNNAHLVREELGLTGASFGPKSIGKINGIVSSKCVGRDMDEDIIEFIPVLKEVINSKMSSNKYPDETILLCAIFPEKPFSFRNWVVVMRQIYASIQVKYKTVILDTFNCQHFWMNKSNCPTMVMH